MAPLEQLEIDGDRAQRLLALAHAKGLVWRSPNGRLLAACGQFRCLELAPGLAPRRLKSLAQELLLEMPDAGASEHPMLFFALGFDPRTQPSPQPGGKRPTWPALKVWVPTLVLSQELPGADFSVYQYGADESEEISSEELSKAPFETSLYWEEDEDEASWGLRVRTLIDEIDGGALEKVVLARSVRASAPPQARFSSRATFDALAKTHPDASVFSLNHQGEAFLGATPERLVKLEAGRLSTHALAGTFSSADENSEPSEKLRHEHACVISAIAEDLHPFLADALSIPERPSRRKAGSVVHLETAISGDLKPGVDLLDLVDALHPTPALAGAPRQASLDYLQRSEAFDRGMYGGVIGWMSARGEGEALVAIRSGHIERRGGAAHAYAGAGVVSGSNPHEEWLETQAKLQAFTSCLRLSSEPSL
ncbi:MAG: isochorismate synthase [Myxococcota bacterium]|nr:isochorismate synthase [Myxococcota bacterium]